MGVSQQACYKCPCPTKTYPAVSLIHTWQVDLGDEGNLRRDVGIVLAAADLQTVNAVLVYTLSGSELMPVSLEAEGMGVVYVRRTEDGAVPVGHEEVVSLVETV